MKSLPLGKLPIHLLNRTVLKMTGASSAILATPPKAGLDFAAIRMPKGFLLISADPITGVTSDIGNYAVQVSANDVATSGNRPQFAESILLLPEGSTEVDVASVAKQMDLAAKKLGIAIVGGHTEVTPGLKRPIVAVTAFCIAKEFVTSGDAQAGDVMMMTKTAGLEGTAAIAGGPPGLLAGLPRGVVKRGKEMIGRLSVVEDATLAFATGRVNALHDCTEGGVLGATYEMSLASGLGFRLYEQEIPIARETSAICSALSVDPLKLTGSGALLLSVKKGGESDVRRALKGVCQVAAVGEFTKHGRVLVHQNGLESKIGSAPEDELWRILGESS